MGSSQTSLLRGTKNTSQSLLNTDDIGAVYVASVRIKKTLGIGVHHGIVVVVDRYNYYIAYQWGQGCNNSLYKYAACYDKSNTCLKLGDYKCSQVFQAANAASRGAVYGTNYNCNHWTQCVARKLGRNITVHWNCSCA